MARSHDEESVQSLYLALGVTISIFLLELLGGLYSNSLSLISDAAHMFFDAFALLLTISAIKISCKIPSKRITFGFHRVEVFAALINGFLLVFVSLSIIKAAIARLLSPSQILSTPMLIVAVIGFLANLIVLKKFHVHDDLNVKGAYLHVASDTLTSVGVIIGAIVIKLTGFLWVDGVLSLVIAGFIALNSARLIKSSTRILLQGSPANADVDEIIGEIKKFKHVLDMHHVHLWTLCSKINVLTAHVVVDYKDLETCEKLTDKINKRLRKFNVGYTTFQFETRAKIKKKKFVHLNHEH